MRIEHSSRPQNQAHSKYLENKTPDDILYQGQPSVNYKLKLKFSL